MRVEIPRCLSQSISFGTSSGAASDPGFEMIPMVLMTGMQQELLVAFGAEDGAVHDLRSESELLDGQPDAVARGLVDGRVADDPALAHLSPAGFKLRLDQYNHLPVRPEQRDRGGQDQGHRNEAHVADDEVDRLADGVEGQLARVDVLVEDDARVGPDRPGQLPRPDVHRV